VSYDYQVAGAFRVRAEKEYPWPCEPLPHRRIVLFPSDVLTKAVDGTVTRHTGLMMLRIRVPYEDLEPICETVTLHVGGMDEWLAAP
jgi:hypothetical protein